MYDLWNHWNTTLSGDIANETGYADTLGPTKHPKQVTLRNVMLFRQRSITVTLMETPTHKSINSSITQEIVIYYYYGCKESTFRTFRRRDHQSGY